MRQEAKSECPRGPPGPAPWGQAQEEPVGPDPGAGPGGAGALLDVEHH